MCSLNRMPALVLQLQLRQRGLAVEEWAIAQILAVMLDEVEVEGIEDRGGPQPPWFAADSCRMAKKPEAPKPTSWDVYKIAKKAVLQLAAKRQGLMILLVPPDRTERIDPAGRRTDPDSLSASRVDHLSASLGRMRGQSVQRRWTHLACVGGQAGGCRHSTTGRREVATSIRHSALWERDQRSRVVIARSEILSDVSSFSVHNDASVHVAVRPATWQARRAMDRNALLQSSAKSVTTHLRSWAGWSRCTQAVRVWQRPREGALLLAAAALRAKGGRVPPPAATTQVTRQRPLLSHGQRRVQRHLIIDPVRVKLAGPPSAAPRGSFRLPISSGMRTTLRRTQ
jgi:hypothetical protein